MEIRIEDARYFGACIETVSLLVEEANMQFLNEGIEIVAMDSSAIALIEFNLPNKVFSKYDVLDEKLGINFKDLNKIMSRAREDESLVLKKDKDKLNVIFLKDKSQRKYKINLIQLDKEVKKLKPKAEIEVKVAQSEFLNVLKNTALVAEYLQFKTDKNKLMIYGNGSYAEVESDFIDIDSKNEIKVMFNLKYLLAMASKADKDSEIKLTLANNEPLSLNYNIRDASIKFVLAPYMNE
jgi:proliferating cell nuclear antigen PCNA